MTAIRTFFQEFWNRIPQIGVNDIIDILIVAFLFYPVMRLIRSTSAARIARSILLLLVVTGLTEIFKLYTLNWILSKILEIGVIALVIMFQPELRRMLERFGGRFFSNLISSSGSRTAGNRGDRRCVRGHVEGKGRRASDLRAQHAA